MNNRCSLIIHFCVGCVVIITTLLVLFVDNIAFVWIVVGLLGLDALYLTMSNGLRWRSNNKKIFSRERFLAFWVSLMFLFLVTGTALFMRAFMIERELYPSEGETAFYFINAEYLLRSLACSFQLFTGSIDSNVLDGIRDHQYLKGLISLQSILSFCCTIAVLLGLVYARAMAYYKLHRRTKIDSSHNHMYVFFGMDDSSCMLAKSIRKHEGEKAVIVFVENTLLNEDNTSGWDGVIGMFTHRRQTFVYADEIGARVTFTEQRLCDIDKDKIGNADILGEINLVCLRDLIQGICKGVGDAQLHIFFLSENEDENIRALSVLSQDSTLKQAQTGINLRIYCHARRNDLNRIVEDIAFKNGLDVRTIDSSYLAVELLKADESNHPVHFVELDELNPTTIKSAFTSLIVGFDEVGRDALKYLYEFGAFIDSKATPSNEKRSIFRCVVADKRMDELVGTFESFSPTVMTQRNSDKNNSNLVELKSCDCLSSDFYVNILNDNFCRNLNYIVIAVGDDELGMTLAIRILNYIRKGRPDLHALRIYVRSYRSDKEAYMQKIADYYNEGYNKGLRNASYKNDAVIKLFGQSKDIYSYDTIINEMLTQKGRKYQESYARLRGESILWDDRRKKELGKGTLDNMRSLRRKELQDLGNALHAETKVYLLKKAMGDNFDWNDFLNRYFDDNNMPLCEGSYDKIKYPLLTKKENEVILNLARLEHLRWNASHEMLGYRKAHAGLHSCDERTREHNCLRPWHELDDESRATLNSDWPCDYKLFDFSVVDNSILLNKEKLLSDESN